jgi:hypothetical protein
MSATVSDGRAPRSAVMGSAGSRSFVTAPVEVYQVGALPTADGGARQPEADLWCSYAATRTLRWLGARPADGAAVADYLRSRQNADGGFAWQRGLPSDVWASYYCAQSLHDLGEPVPALHRLADWLAVTRTADGGFAMTPGQSADVWATYYACRLYAEVLGRPVPDRAALAHWLAGLQVRGGGLGWSPGSRQVDVRAGYYGALAWRAAGGDSAPWDTGGLVRWLQDRQGSDGGFAFVPGTPACAWAAFRATHALRALGAGPRDLDGLLAWLDARRLPSGGYERWSDYGVTDVWACFSVVGARLAVDRPLPPADVATTVDVVRGCQLPGTGYTYRPADTAGDSLATAAVLLGGAEPERIAGLQGWLRAAQTPYEGGVMYMPGRGAEVRCTLWAAAALNRTGSGLDSVRLGPWIRGLQNVDGGVGYWVGRGSDLVSTTAAVELAEITGWSPAEVLDRDGVLRFLDRCRTRDGHAPVHGAETTLAATAQAVRVGHALGVPTDPERVTELLRPWASALGGYAATPRAVPDLLSTYQAVLALERLGRTWDRRHVGRLLRRLAVDGGYAWSPLSHRPGGVLAGSLGRLLATAAAGDAVPLPPLSL